MSVLPLTSHAQSLYDTDSVLMDALKQQAEREKRQQSQPNQQPYWNTQPAQKPKEDWGALADALGQIIDKPAGETEYERRQRMQSIGNDLINLNQDYKRQQMEYQRSRNRPMHSLEELTGNRDGLDLNSGSSSGYGNYNRQREERLRWADRVLNYETENAGKKAAGFNTDAIQDSSASSPAVGNGLTPTPRASRRSIDNLRASDVQKVNDKKPEKPKKYCACKGGDVPFYGVACHPKYFDYWDEDTYEMGAYPWTSTCKLETYE